ncbi:MAG: CBS domain-containing protein [Planctomycetaceae bacterium]|nr:CBS domain-containing protein [Planctomycetaceae bacterium]
MHCPDCRYDNIPGADICQKCGKPLPQVELSASEMERSIMVHPVSVLAIKAPVSVAPTATVRSAVDAMIRNKIGCVLIVDGSALAGIFTERDVLNRVSPQPGALDRPISEFMTPSPETLRTGDSIAYALHSMTMHGLRHLPVVDANGQAVSIVSIRDVLRLLAVRFADIRSA